MRFSLTAKQREQITITYHKAIRRASATLKRNCYLAFPHQFTKLGQLLGFEEQVLTEGSHLATYEPLTYTSFHNLHICSDLISPQFIGASLYPVLQTVTLRGQRDELLTYRFSHPQFYKVCKDSVQLIDMSVLNSEGDVVQFQKGAVICTLVFVWP